MTHVIAVAVASASTVGVRGLHIPIGGRPKQPIAVDDGPAGTGLPRDHDARAAPIDIGAIHRRAGCPIEIGTRHE
jgi:hypothetical protein